MMCALAIIPNEEKLNIEPYYKDLEEGEAHGHGIEVFCKKQNIPITAESLGLNEGEYPGYVWQLALVSLGHIVICFDEELWIFLPERLSFNQLNWMNENNHFIKKYRKTLNYVVSDENQNIIEACEYYTCNDTYKRLFAYINSLESERSR